MSYQRKVQYKIISRDSYQVVRNCPGCGCKTMFQNTKNFRMNANGKRIDIWLIYQCENCKHTFNLSLYERIRPEEIPSELYQKFLANDGVLAEKLGMDKALFLRNNANLEEKKRKLLLKPSGEVPDCFLKGDLIEIENPYGIKVRPEKILADVLDISRSRAEGLVKKGIIDVTYNKAENYIRFVIKEEM